MKGSVKLLRNTFFKRQKKKKNRYVLEMKLTKSPSTEDGVKTSQMLWGVQLQNVIKPGGTFKERGIDFPVTQYTLQTSKSSKHQTHFQTDKACFGLLMVSVILLRNHFKFSPVREFHYCIFSSFKPLFEKLCLIDLQSISGRL